MRFVHFSDLHIDHNLVGKRDPDTGVPFRVMDMVRLLDTVIDYAIDKEVDFVVFAGDMYHRYEPKQEYKEFIHKSITRLVDHGIPIYIVVGNHDRIKRFNSRHALHEFTSLKVGGVYVFEEVEVFNAEDYTIIAIPWQYSPVSLENLEIDYSKPSIVVAHTTIFGAEYRYGMEATSEMDLGTDFVMTKNQFDNFTYAALGHIHRPQVISTDPPIIYPGSVGYHTWGEVGDPPHGFVDVIIDKNGVSWELIEYNDRPQIDLFITASTLDDVLDQLPEQADEDAMYRVTVDWDHKDNAGPFIEDRLREAVLINIRERYPREKNRASRLEFSDQPTMEELLSAYFEVVDEDFDDEMRELWREIEEEVRDG